MNTWNFFSMYCINNQLLTVFTDVQMHQLTVRLHTTIFDDFRFSFLLEYRNFTTSEKQKTLTTKQTPMVMDKQINLIFIRNIASYILPEKVEMIFNFMYSFI